MLHIIDLFVGTLPLLLRTESFNPLHHDPSIPGAVKDGDMACLWHTVPEPPQIVVDLLNVIGSRCWIHPVAPGIQIAGQTFDGSALASGIPSLKTDDNRNSEAVKFAVKLCQSLLKLFQPGLILLLRKAL